MLETALKDQLRTIFAPLDSRYTFLIRLNPRHENRNELMSPLVQKKSITGWKKERGWNLNC